MKVSWRVRADGYKPLDSKLETAKINGRDKYHSDLYRNYLENNIINERKQNEKTN